MKTPPGIRKFERKYKNKSRKMSGKKKTYFNYTK